MRAKSACDCIVAILSTDGRTPVGTGFLIGKKVIVTCRHVIKDPNAFSLLDSFTEEVRDGEFVDFDISQGAHIDIALIKIHRDFTKKKPALLLDTSEDIRITWCSFGFPEGFPKGAPIESGHIGSETGEKHRILIDTKSDALFVAPGYSGAPVWDLIRGGVVGVMSELVRCQHRRIGLMIPTEVVAKSSKTMNIIMKNQVSPNFDRNECTRLWRLSRAMQLEGDIINYIESKLCSNTVDPMDRYWMYKTLGRVGGRRAEAIVRSALSHEVYEFSRRGAEEAAVLLSIK